MQLLALDGVYLMPKSRLVKHLILLQGSRASVAVKCNASGTYYLMSVSTVDSDSPFYNIGSLESKSVQILSTLQVDDNGSKDDDTSAFDLSGIPRPSYLRSFSAENETTLDKFSISTEQVFIYIFIFMYK
jgi:hypothetical protein